jgi:NAD(P)-dependent dehydrogenase (short-subunit alcohol dehydrogenase family)
MANFNVEGRVAVITGGTGVLGRVMARSLAEAGARIVVIGRDQGRAAAEARRIEERGGEALGLAGDVRSREAMIQVRGSVLRRFTAVDILINAAGGNIPAATVDDTGTVFDLSIDAIDDVLRLNLSGTIVPTLVFAPQMAERQRGSIINISSMTATRAVSRVVGYAASKSAVENFTRWMAVELARKFGDGLRVNAIAPGFFVTDQNRELLIAKDGKLTDRGETIVAHTPMGRFGRPEELLGAIHWLCSDASSFVTGSVIPIDGGFGAFSGV